MVRVQEAAKEKKIQDTVSDIVEKLTKLVKEQHVKSDLFPIRALDGQ